MGKPTSGIMEASLSFLGVYSQCVGIRAPEETFSGRYCLANVQLSPTARSTLEVIQK